MIPNALKSFILIDYKQIQKCVLYESLDINKNFKSLFIIRPYFFLEAFSEYWSKH